MPYVPDEEAEEHEGCVENVDIGFVRGECLVAAIGCIFAEAVDDTSLFLSAVNCCGDVATLTVISNNVAYSG